MIASSIWVGHSLLAAQIASEICDRFQIELPVLKLFQAPTVCELAVLVAGSALAMPQPNPRDCSLPQPVSVLLPLLNCRAMHPKWLQRRATESSITMLRGARAMGVGSASFFLDYRSLREKGTRRKIVAECSNRRNSVGLGSDFELIGDTQ